MIKKYALFSLFLGLIFTSHSVSAQSAAPALSIDNFSANYYLDRDADKVSVLSAEEAITVKYPLSGKSFTGFTRVIPTSYLKNSNDLKLTGVTDASGNPAPYKIGYDKDKNMVVTIGDPAVTVYGTQAYIIHYQARGVINFLKDYQQFYPNFNGRGWDAPFGNISATIHLSNSLASNLIGTQICLIDSGRCQVNITKSGKDTLVIAKSLNGLSAHQSMTAKLSFKNGTFAAYNKGGTSLIIKIGLIIFCITGILLLMAAVRSVKLKKGRKSKVKLANHGKSSLKD